jgi:hypothetical protein
LTAPKRFLDFEKENALHKNTILRGVAAAALLVTFAACESRPRDGTAGNPPSTATQRAYDSATGSPRTPADGTRGNPSGTAAERTFDRAAGTDTSGAYPAQRDGTAANPPGTAASRAYDRATGSNTSGAYPGVRR